MIGSGGGVAASRGAAALFPRSRGYPCLLLDLWTSL